MSKGDKISFIIPVYNCAEYLTDCLESIIRLNYHNKEIILINDGSTDSTPTIGKTYADKYEYINFISQPNKGTSSARNRGIELASGDYIWFVDSDDMIASDIISRIEPYITHNTEIICFNHIEKTSDGNIEKKTFDYEQEISALSLLERGTPGYLWNKIFRRDIIGTHRFLEGTKNIEDFLFCIQVIKDANVISLLPHIGYIYNCTNQTSTSRNRSEENLLKLSSDSFRVHLELNRIIRDCHESLKPILSNMLYVSIAGHLRSLVINYNRHVLSDAICFYKKHALYPLKTTRNKKANIFIMAANVKYFLYAIAYIYDLKNHRKI